VNGATLDLTTREGRSGALTIPVLEDVDGTPTLRIVGGLTNFDATGGSTFTAISRRASPATDARSARSRTTRRSTGS